MAHAGGGVQQGGGPSAWSQGAWGHDRTRVPAEGTCALASSQPPCCSNAPASPAGARNPPHGLVTWGLPNRHVVAAAEHVQLVGGEPSHARGPLVQLKLPQHGAAARVKHLRRGRGQGRPVGAQMRGQSHARKAFAARAHASGPVSCTAGAAAIATSLLLLRRAARPAVRWAVTRCLHPPTQVSAAAHCPARVSPLADGCLTGPRPAPRTSPRPPHLHHPILPSSYHQLPV